MWCHTSCPGNFIGLALPAYVPIAPITVCVMLKSLPEVRDEPTARAHESPTLTTCADTHKALWSRTDRMTDVGADSATEGKTKKCNTGRRNKKDASKTAERERKKKKTKPRGAVAMATSRGVRVCGCHGNGQPLTLRSLCTISCWWIWLTLSKIWLMQWLQREREEDKIGR